MSKSLAFTALALLAASAHAQQAYVGATIAGARMEYQGAPDTARVEDKVLFGKLYGGYAFNETFALEGGWAAYGKAKFGKADTGAPYDASFDANLVYAALRGTYRFDERWSVSGKLGQAWHYQRDESGGALLRSHARRLMVGVGGAYDLTPNTALTLEFNDYGTVRTVGTERKVRKFEAGARFSF
jgi:OmpA-OmpF porin, OOP family